MELGSRVHHHLLMVSSKVSLKKSPTVARWSSRHGAKQLALWLSLLSVLNVLGLGQEGRGEEPSLHRFKRIQLTDVYYSEGANAGDINRDGHPDAVYGPHWYAGPDFQTKHPIYAAKPQPRDGYADHFFAWLHDFDADGWLDVFVVGFPGTPAYVYRNPGDGGWDRDWTKHEVFDWVSNESPHFTNLVGDAQPELVCSRDGFFGYATFEPGKGLDAWKFHPISEQIADGRFGHGLGVGDVNNDGRLDVLIKDGWLEQPTELSQPRWVFHPFEFTAAGGAEIYAYDIDGDGDQDVITSLAAHEYGLAWFEQIQENEQVTFRRHLIMGDHPSENRYGLVFTELHSVALHDMDGDGLKDIVTGKTYWSHHMRSPMWDAGAVVYWFRLVRAPQDAPADQPKVDWVPYLADSEAGIGRQLVVAELNHDGLPDLVVGGMKGGHVLIHEREAVTREAWDAAQPKVYSGPAKPAPEAVSGAELDAATGRAPGALEGEQIKVVGTTGGDASTQDMGGFPHGRWSGRRQLFWTGAKPGDRLEVEIMVEQPGEFEIEAVMTKARDYAIVQWSHHNQPLGEPIDLFHEPEVITTGVVKLGKVKLDAGPQRFTVEIKGANPSAVASYLFGLDFLRLK